MIKQDFKRRRAFNGNGSRKRTVTEKATEKEWYDVWNTAQLFMMFLCRAKNKRQRRSKELRHSVNVCCFHPHNQNNDETKLFNRKFLFALKPHGVKRARIFFFFFTPMEMRKNRSLPYS